MSYRHHALHSLQEVESYYKQISDDIIQYTYANKILAHIENMEQGDWFDIRRNVKEENIPSFIKTVCVLYQMKVVFITFNEGFTKFRKD